MSSEGEVFIHPNLKKLSYSSSLTLHACPAKYELYKLSPHHIIHEANADFDFGHQVGLGTQEYIVHQNKDKVYWQMFLSNKGILHDEEGAKKKKTFFHALEAVDRFVPFYQENLFEWKIAEFDGKPATELGFYIDCGNGWCYRGFVDAVLLNKMRFALGVYEGKTTGSYNINEAMYGNSGQALGYSLVTDEIAKLYGQELVSDYEVNYAVYQSLAQEWTHFKFHKSRTQRAMWIKQLLLDIKHISEYAEEEYFPLYGESCFNYMRQCEFYDTCTISRKYLFMDLEKIPEEQDDMSKYQFQFHLSDIIQTQLAEGV